MENKKVKSIALFGVMTALAFGLGYIESLIPLGTGIPGVKAGLANLAVVCALYLFGPKQAFAVSVIRIFLSSITFGNFFSLVYSLCGGLLSFAVMAVSKRTKLSVVGVSMLGGIFHNIGQLAAAAAVTQTVRIVYYFPVLLVSGLISGFLIGIVSKAIIERLRKALEL